MSFWKSLLFPKGPKFIHSKLFSSCFVSFKVPKCEQCLRYDCLFLSQASSITGLPCEYASVLSFNAHTSWLHMPSRVRHTTLFSYLPGTYFWCNWLLIYQIHVCHWGLCIECLWLSLAFVFLAIVYCNSHFAVSAMLQILMKYLCWLPLDNLGCVVSAIAVCSLLCLFFTLSIAVTLQD